MFCLHLGIVGILLMKSGCVLMNEQADTQGIGAEIRRVHFWLKLPHGSRHVMAAQTQKGDRPMDTSFVQPFSFSEQDVESTCNKTTERHQVPAARRPNNSRDYGTTSSLIPSLHARILGYLRTGCHP